MQDSARLVVFTGDLSYNVRRNMVDLGRRMPGLSWLVLVHSPRKTIKGLIKSQRFNLRKHGWRWVPYQLGDALSRLLPKPEVKTSSDAPGAEYSLNRLVADGRVRVEYVSDIHAESSLAMVRDFAPDLGLSLAAPILKPALFKLPKLGSINLHKGKLPDYRGMPPAFWELWTDQDSVGVSVHWVDEKLDQGAVLAESSVVRERFSTVRGLQIRLDELGSELVCQATEQVLSGTARARVQVAGVGKTYRKPTLAQEGQLAAKLGATQPAAPKGLKVWLKSGYARLAFAMHGWLLWRFLAPRVTVLLFHRVCDDARDNLSVGVEQFERQMRLLRERCEVLSIEQVLHMKQVPRSRKPLVAVTFDDGYLDNCTNAAPSLRRFGVPAAFFVSTGIVATERAFPHDQRRGNSPIAVLGWDDLRHMRDWGFTLGSHTVNHADCVATDEAQVRDELAQSRDDLNRELGPRPLIFAYPYGGRHQMNDQRLALVKDAGYVANLSAFGGSNIKTVDPWCVLRRGIHWEFSDTAFLYQCLGYG